MHSPDLATLVKETAPTLVTPTMLATITAQQAARDRMERRKVGAPRRSLEEETKRTVAEPEVLPREASDEKRPGHDRNVEWCDQPTPVKPAGRCSATEAATFAVSILGHLLAHGALTPIRINGKIVTKFCMWLGYALAYGVPSSGGGRTYKHKMVYVAMQVAVRTVRSRPTLNCEVQSNSSFHVDVLFCRILIRACCTFSRISRYPRLRVKL